MHSSFTSRQEQIYIQTLVHNPNLHASMHKIRNIISAHTPAHLPYINMYISPIHIYSYQRAVWVKIAKEYGVIVEAVFLNADKDTCAERCKARLVHEGGVTGKGAGRIIGMCVCVIWGDRSIYGNRVTCGSPRELSYSIHTLPLYYPLIFRNISFLNDVSSKNPFLRQFNSKSRSDPEVSEGFARVFLSDGSRDSVRIYAALCNKRTRMA